MFNKRIISCQENEYLRHYYLMSWLKISYSQAINIKSIEIKFIISKIVAKIEQRRCFTPNSEDKTITEM